MNYKIKVENEAESKEAQELFMVLGYMVVNNIDCEKGYIVASKNAESPINFDYWHDVKNIITIQELRDLVVLKRNDPEDGTHIDRDNKPWYVASDGLFYCFEYGKEWVKEKKRVFDNYQVKPITKEESMKEYLEPTQANFLVKTDEGYIVQVLDENTVAADCYLIPDGAKCATTCLDDGELFTLFWKGECKICVGYDEEWFNIKRDIDDYLKDNPDANIVWQREPIDKNEQVLKEILGVVLKDRMLLLSRMLSKA